MSRPADDAGYFNVRGWRLTDDRGTDWRGADKSRGRDKADKSAEAAKFFINALYVAVTRAVRALSVIESDVEHPLPGLPELDHPEARLNLVRQQSSAEDGSREARRLALQGRQEQADQIRRQVLETEAVPWTVQDSAWSNRTFENALTLTERYGLDFRNPFNHTPPMLAARVGNAPLAAALPDAGANPALTDNDGRNAFQLFLDDACSAARAESPAAAGARFLALHRCLAPGSFSFRIERKLVKLDAQTIEFTLFNPMLAASKRHLQLPERGNPGFDTKALAELLAAFPDAIVAEGMRQRQYRSGALARNEQARDCACNRCLFLRLRQGRDRLNPCILVKVGEDWLPLPAPLDLELMALDADEWCAAGLIKRMLALAAAEMLEASSPDIAAAAANPEPRAADGPPADLFSGVAPPWPANRA